MEAKVVKGIEVLECRWGERVQDQIKGSTFDTHLDLSPVFSLGSTTTFYLILATLDQLRGRVSLVIIVAGFTTRRGIQ